MKVFKYLRVYAHKTMKVYQSESYRSFFESSIIEICGALRNSSLYVEGKADLSEKVLYTTTVNLRDHYHVYLNKNIALFFVIFCFLFRMCMVKDHQSQGQFIFLTVNYLKISR